MSSSPSASTSGPYGAQTTVCSDMATPIGLRLCSAKGNLTAMTLFSIELLNPIRDRLGSECGHEGGALIRGMERSEAELDRLGMRNSHSTARQLSEVARASHGTPVPRRENRVTSIPDTGLLPLITEANRRRPRQTKLDTPVRSPRGAVLRTPHLAVHVLLDRRGDRTMAPA
jgi:hypothetical protein